MLKTFLIIIGAIIAACAMLFIGLVVAVNIVVAKIAEEEEKKHYTINPIIHYDYDKRRTY